MICRWHPGLDGAAEAALRDVKAFVSNLVAGTDISIDLAKRTQVAIVAPNQALIDRVQPEIQAFLDANHPGFRLFVTPISLDIVEPHLTKREGMSWLAEICGLALDEIAFIGDTGGDIGALKSVGRSFAPANADTSVKEIVDVVAAASDVDGVVEAYENVIDLNKNANPQG